MKSKAEIISQIFNNADVLIVKETHVPVDQTNRLKIDRFQLVNFSGHFKHSTVTFINQNWDPRYVSIIEDNEHSIGMCLDHLNIFNIYKPLSER